MSSPHRDQIAAQRHLSSSLSSCWRIRTGTELFCYRSIRLTEMSTEGFSGNNGRVSAFKPNKHSITKVTCANIALARCGRLCIANRREWMKFWMRRVFKVLKIIDLVTPCIPQSGYLSTRLDIQLTDCLLQVVNGVPIRGRPSQPVFGNIGCVGSTWQKYFSVFQVVQDLLQG